MADRNDDIVRGHRYLRPEFVPRMVSDKEDRAMAGANVLVIEDDQANADVLTDALRSEEVRVDAGREFLAVTR